MTVLSGRLREIYFLFFTFLQHKQPTKSDHLAVQNSTTLCLYKEQAGVYANSREFLFIPTTMPQPSPDKKSPSHAEQPTDSLFCENCFRYFLIGHKFATALIRLLCSLQMDFNEKNNIDEY